MNQAEMVAILAKRVQTVEERIQAACRRAGRGRNEVQLVAVTKTITPEVAALLPELGVLDLGESRPQELWRKAELLPKSIRWHLIGHLQRNKIERTLPLISLIHSVDSLRLLDALEADACKRGQTLPVLLEINVSGEQNKHGFPLDNLNDVIARVQTLKHVRAQGLMTMAALDADLETCRQTFFWLRGLRDCLRAGLEPMHSVEHLSMGMTNDFEVAIEEGATLVRIGSALFANLPEGAA